MFADNEGADHTVQMRRLIIYWAHIIEGCMFADNEGADHTV